MIESAKSGLCFSFGDVRHVNGGSYALDARCVSLFVVHEGRISIDVDGASEELNAGECGLYVSHQSIKVLYPTGIATQTSWCEAQYCGPLFTIDGEIIPPLSHVEASQLMRTLLRLGLDLGSDISFRANRLRNAIGDAILSAYLVEQAFGAETAIPSIVLKVREYVDRHFAEQCDLSRLAGSVGVTREYLVSVFRKHLGTTPVRYLWELRTRKAAHLVQSTTLGLAEIADQCGYKSQFHLSREIKRMTGESPRDLRRRGAVLLTDTARCSLRPTP